MYDSFNNQIHSLDGDVMILIASMNGTSHKAILMVNNYKILFSSYKNKIKIEKRLNY